MYCSKSGWWKPYDCEDHEVWSIQCGAMHSDMKIRCWKPLFHFMFDSSLQFHILRITVRLSIVSVLYSSCIQKFGELLCSWSISYRQCEKLLNPSWTFVKYVCESFSYLSVLTQSNTFTFLSPKLDSYWTRALDHSHINHVSISFASVSDLGLRE